MGLVAKYWKEVGTHQIKIYQVFYKHGRCVRMKRFDIVYSINETEKKISLVNIPEEISLDEYKLSVYLKQVISNRESVEDRDVSIISAVCIFQN